MSSRPVSPRRRRLAALVAVASTFLALAAGLGAGARAQGTPAEDAAVARASASIAGSHGADVLSLMIQRALLRTTYPKSVVPTIGDPSAEVELMRPEAKCLNPPSIYGVNQCNFGKRSAKKLAVVIGDSVSIAYLPGLIPALTSQGYRVHGLALGSCPVADVQMNLPYDRAGEKRCNESHEKIYLQVQRLHPDLVIMSDSASGIMRLASGNRYQPAIDEWTEGMSNALDYLRFPGRRLVILGPNPAGEDPADCYKPGGRPKQCVTDVHVWQDWKRTAEENAAAEAGAKYVDTLSWYCFEGKCPAFALGISQRWDQSHLSWAYSQMLAPLLRRAVLGPRH